MGVRVPRVVLVAVLALGLSSGSGGAQSPETGVQISLAETARAFDIVELEGVPYTGKPDAVQVVVSVDGEEVQLPIFEPLTRPHISVPLATATPFEEWDLQLSIRFDGQEVSTPTIRVEPLPRSDGAWQEFLEEFERHIDRSSELAGSSYDALAASPMTDLPMDLFPVRLAQEALGSDGTGLRSVYDELPSDDDRRLLDAFTARLGLIELVSGTFDPRLPAGLVLGRAAEEPVRIASYRGVAAMPAALLAAAQAPSTLAGCEPNTLTIGSDQDLANLMQEGREAVAENRPGGPVDRVEKEIITNVLLAGGFLPGLYGDAFNAANVAFVVYLAMRHRKAGVYPTSLARLTSTVDTSVFNEDFTAAGTWKDVEVTAVATGWEISDDLGAVIASIAGLVGSHVVGVGSESLWVWHPNGGSGLIFKDLVAKHLSENALVAILVEALNKLADVLPGSVCGKSWTVPLRPQFVKVSSVRGWLDTEYKPQYSPSLEGPHAPFEDVLKIEADSAMFSGAQAFQHHGISVTAIEISASPSSVTVQRPGDPVQIEVTVAKADDISVSWEIEPGKFGSWGTASQVGGSGPVWTNTFTTSEHADHFPYQVYIESASQSGLRARGEPRRRAVVNIFLQTFRLTAAPDTIRPAESSLLRAFDDQDQPVDVTWTASGGSLVETGPGTAEFSSLEPGLYQVTAIKGPGQTRTVTITVIDPDCYFEFSIGGAAFVAEQQHSLSWWTRDGGSRVRMGDVRGRIIQAQLEFTDSESMTGTGGSSVTGTGPYNTSFANFSIDGEERGAQVINGKGSVQITTYEDGSRVAGHGSGEVVSPDGGYTVDPIPYAFEFVVSNSGHRFFSSSRSQSSFECYVGGKPPSR